MSGCWGMSLTHCAVIDVKNDANLRGGRGQSDKIKRRGRESGREGERIREEEERVREKEVMSD